MTKPRQQPDGPRLAAALLDWYDVHRRDLPWRARLGEIADPYRVWLSEIMCQQTTVATAAPYYRAFLQRWPNVRALAAARLDEVLHGWQGLGYYHRARNLSACAQKVVSEYGGTFPDDEATLRTLPGIGPYTAAAVAALAFGRKATPVDGNVERVTARLFAVEASLPGAKRRLRELAATLTPDRRTGDFAQAMMDLGAMVCVPRQPRCGDCPWSSSCSARRQGIAEQLPRKSSKPARPVRHGVVFWIVNADGAVLLRRRPAGGLLGGMMEFPSTPWRERPWDMDEAKAHAPLAARWTVAGEVRHVFSHFALELTVAAGRTRARSVEGLWCQPADLGDHALPSVMKKVAGLARSGRLG